MVGAIVNGTRMGMGIGKTSGSLDMEINQRSSMHYLLKDTLKGNLSYGVCWISVFGMDEG
jgi:hypothetical protein